MTIICTYGPRLFDPLVLNKALSLNDDIRIRIPSSKGDPSLQLDRLLNGLRNSVNLNNVIVDFPGSKFRLSNKESLTIQQGSEYPIYFCSHDGGLTIEPQVRMEDITEDFIVVGDGEVALEVVSINESSMTVRPTKTITLGPRRGVTFSTNSACFDTLTDEDVSYFDVLVREEIEGVMLSFVESKSDVIEAKKRINKVTSREIKIYAKIETEEGINNLEQIDEVSDFIVLGRGDLLLNVGYLNFAKLQRIFLDKMSQNIGKVVLGTEILVSLSENFLPSRSELTSLDYFNSLGVSNYLLSNEVTTGNSPIRTINVLNQLTQ